MSCAAFRFPLPGCQRLSRLFVSPAPVCGQYGSDAPVTFLDLDETLPDKRDLQPQQHIFMEVPACDTDDDCGETSLELIVRKEWLLLTVWIVGLSDVFLHVQLSGNGVRREDSNTDFRVAAVLASMSCAAFRFPLPGCQRLSRLFVPPAPVYGQYGSGAPVTFLTFDATLPK
ncbi:uncharacterized protein EMH_0018030 [Eimeria mitis]|uniref:Uncharacterized protein n=1 Tax=Eimeria mitis TaxID=44415 RepID=U6KAW7_9EIME|nr:uncharacterized protein EMH_0018030 [Eimeria mitis]CDJ33931.1 hypothetical protein, conserved [Eimeria mitis]